MHKNAGSCGKFMRNFREGLKFHFDSFRHVKLHKFFFRQTLQDPVVFLPKHEIYLQQLEYNGLFEGFKTADFPTVHTCLELQSVKGKL